MEHKNAVSLSRLCGTVAQTIGVPAPKQAAAGLDWASAILQEHAGGPITRTLIYNPDAVAQWLLHKYRQFRRQIAQTQHNRPHKVPVAENDHIAFAQLS